jgi:hypothetical protein
MGCYGKPGAGCDAARQHGGSARRLDVATQQLGEALSQVRALTDQRPARRRWWSWW